MANEPLDPSLNPDPNIASTPDTQDQAVTPDQTPIDTLNDVLDMGEDVKDTVDQVKDLKEKLTKKPPAQEAELGATEGAAEGAAGTETAAGTEAAGAKLGQSAAKTTAKEALEKETVATGRTGWLHATKGKIAEGQAKIAARQAARTAERQAVKQAGKAAAKWGAKAAARWSVEAASGLADAGLSWILLAADVLLTALYAIVKKWGKYILFGFFLLLAAPGLIFLFIFGSIGWTQTPSTEAEKAQTVTALALGADPGASREVIINAVSSMKERLTRIKADLPSGSAAIARIEAVLVQLTELTKIADKPEERKMLMAAIDAELKSISQAYPDILYSPGTCADLQTYVDNGALKDGRSSRMIDIRSLPKGFLNRGGHSQISRDEQGQIPADPKLCNVVKFILDNGFTIGAVTITYGHRQFVRAGVTSQHYVGQAIDLAMVNGAAYGNDRWKTETEKLMTLLRTHNKDLHIYQMIGPHALGIQRCTNSTVTDSDHQNHIHIGVANKERADRYEACR